MSLTSARIKDGSDVFGMHLVCIRDFTGDSLYPSGGYSLVGTNFGFGNKPLDGVICIGGNAAAAAYNIFYDNVNKKLIFAGAGLYASSYAPLGVDGSANTDIGIASGTLPVNGAIVSILAAANNTTAFTIANQPDIPRNVSISLKNTNVGASTGNAVSFVIVGTFRGAAQTETISFTALELTSTAQNEVATKYGSKPFTAITSITPSAAQPANWQHAAGEGSKLGLPLTPVNNTESDITSITVNGVTVAVTGTFSSTNQTVNVGTLVDGDNVVINYNAGGSIATGTNLSAVVVRLLGICRG